MGKLIVIEGTDGSGKSTQFQLLTDRLSREGHAFRQLEFPQYSRPECWNGIHVPPILLSGDHAKVDAWRREQSLIRTAQRRPDLLEKAAISPKEREFVKNYLANRDEQ
jgi:tRNA (guanine37-N1)-methyltransferase